MLARQLDADWCWGELKVQVQSIAEKESVLRGYLQRSVLDQQSFIEALCYLLAGKLACKDVPARQMRGVLLEAYQTDLHLGPVVLRDLLAVNERDPAARDLAGPFLNHKGFLALEAYRAANYYWLAGRKELASYLQSRISEVFAVDISPGAQIGSGVFIDHATGVVIGETAVVGDNVSLLQSVTLGGTGKEAGDRHPKIGRGVLISAGAIVLGNIRIGDEAKIGAGSVVLNDVPAYTTVVGIPAKPVGVKNGPLTVFCMNQYLSCIDES